MKFTKKVSALALAILMCLSFMPCIASAVGSFDTITIYVDGINAANIIDSQTGEVLYPPAGDKIAKAVVKNLPVLVKALFTGDYKPVVEPLCDVLDELFAPVKVDENGNPPENAVFDFTWQTPEDIMKYVNSSDPAKKLKYAFDWRLDMQTIAAGLHSYIEYVLNVTGEKRVALIGTSMGSCALLSYLELYDYEYVCSAIVNVGAVNGTYSCGQPFAGKIGINGDSVVRFVDTMLGDDFGSILLSSLLHGLNTLGVIDGVGSIAMEMTDQILVDICDKCFAQALGNTPGMWSIVPLDVYEDAKALMGTKLSEKMLERIDWYHYEIQANSAQIMLDCLDRGIHIGVIAKYGFPNIPCIETPDSMTDSVIDTKFASFGATVADAGTTLGENYVQKVDNGHNCISPDNMIDSSTGLLCDYTWFIKNSVHADDFDVISKLTNEIIYSEEQITVWTASLPQYLIIVDGRLVPLSAENDYSKYPDTIGNENIFTVVFNTLKRLSYYFIDAVKTKTIC